MLKELHAIFIGQVQGVGFRYTTEEYARQFNLKGIVRNLSDGSVELIAQGDQKQLQSLMDFLEKEAFPGRVKEIKFEFKEAILHYLDFSIKKNT